MKNKKLYAILLSVIIILVGWFIYSKLTLSCDEIYKIGNAEEGKIIRSCQSGADCVNAPSLFFNCHSSCMNKATDRTIIEKIREISKAGNEKNCYPMVSCVRSWPTECKCINNVCQTE